MPYLSGIPYARDRHVAELATCTTHSIHKRQISMSPAGFVFAFPAYDRTQTYAFRMRDDWDRQLYLDNKLFSKVFSYVVT